MKAQFAQKYGPWAVVTGASRGLGAEFARQLAARGLNLVLVARSTDQLERLAAELVQAHGVDARVVTLDLSREDLLDALAPVTNPLDVGLLVNNAGQSTVGPFLDRDADSLLEQFHTNARAGLILARHFGERMAARGRGGVIFVSSGSALHGTPWSAAYCGTKAYYLMLAEALWAEWRPLGVDVLGFIVGQTRTPGLMANHPKPAPFVPLGESGPVVRQALEALGKRPSAADGLRNRFGYALMGLVPRAAAVRSMGASMNAMFGPFKRGD